jgi:uracil-DNA glycosylase
MSFMEENPPSFYLEKTWHERLSEELTKLYFLQLVAFVEKERSLGPIYPSKDLVFNAFQSTPFDSVRVVIIGQDPYFKPGQAHGLAFSVPCGIPKPPSLRNIFKEIKDDLGLPIPEHGCLLSWAKQGVLLLNVTLTVRAGEPMSHYGKGWENFTDAVLTQICQKEAPVIFVLWGKFAQEKCRLILASMEKKHVLFTASHPSPLSAYQGFLGCRHFSKINELLISWGQEPIDWTV